MYNFPLIWVTYSSHLLIYKSHIDGMVNATRSFYMLSSVGEPDYFDLMLLSHCIVVLAPKLSKFCSVGIFPFTFGAPDQLKKVDMKLDSFGSVYNKNKKVFYPQFTSMLLGFGNARYLTFDLGSFQITLWLVSIW